MKQLLKMMMGNMDEYQPIPFWSWNDQLDEERLKQQIRWMQESGR